MKYNMRAWLDGMMSQRVKKPLPVLSFPSVSLLGVSVKDIVFDAQLQAKGMKLVADRVDSAASVSFMDLSVEAECFGATVSVSNDEVPTVKGRLINDPDEAEALEIPSVESGRAPVYINAIRRAAELICDRPVLAGMIGPFSLAARLLDVSEIMMDCYDEPEMVHTVMEKTTKFLIEYAKAYKAAGANGIVMAEPVSGLLSPSLEEEFSSPYVKKIVDAVEDDSFIIIYHNCGANTPLMTESLLSFGASAYHFGNAINMKDMLEKFPKNVPLMGNVDPAGVLEMGTVEDVRRSTLDIMSECCEYPNFIISSGCDIPPKTPWENIDAFFAAVKEFYGE